MFDRTDCRSKFYIAGMGILDLCCSCDLDLDPMTFIYELDPYSLEIYTACAKMNFISPLFRKVSSADTDIETDSSTDSTIIPPTLSFNKKLSYPQRESASNIALSYGAKGISIC